VLDRHLSRDGEARRGGTAGGAEARGIDPVQVGNAEIAPDAVVNGVECGDSVAGAVLDRHLSRNGKARSPGIELIDPGTVGDRDVAGDDRAGGCDKLNL